MVNVQCWVKHNSGISFMPSGVVREIIESGLRDGGISAYKMVIKHKCWGITEIEAPKTNYARVKFKDTQLHGKEGIVVRNKAQLSIISRKFPDTEIYYITGVSKEQFITVKGREYPVLALLYVD